jgi:Tol biopolymer transport system component
MALVTADSMGPAFDKTLWVLDVQRDILTPLPAGSAVGGATQLWSPDGEWIYYAAAVENDSSTEARGGLGRLGIRSALHRIRADGSSGGEPISGGEGLLPTSISADGTRLYAERQGDIVVIHLDEEFRVEDVITGPASETGGAISPDGSWLAYRSDTSGEGQIYISAADGKGGRVQVSRDGDSIPAWSPDGKNLYFNTGRTRMVVEVKTPTEDEGAAVPAAQGVSASAEDLEISRPTALFDLEPLHGPGFWVTADGEGFMHASLGQGIVGSSEIDEIIVTLNFFLELERLVSDQNK